MGQGFLRVFIFLVWENYFFGFAKLLFGFSIAKICLIECLSLLNPVLMSMNFNGGVANFDSSVSILIQAIQLVVTCEK